MIYFVFRDANLKLSHSKIDYIFNACRISSIKPKSNTDQINLSITYVGANQLYDDL